MINSLAKAIAWKSIDQENYFLNPNLEEEKCLTLSNA